jgi:membrane fusion protein (multidrug efflux system)
MMSRYLYICRPAITGLIVSLFASACSDTETTVVTRRDNTATVIVEAVQFRDEITRLEAVGTSRALQSVTVTPVASGEVVAVNFVPGQRVEKGDILIELDSRNEALALDLARVRLDDAERLFERFKRTENSGAVLPTTIDAAKTAMDIARIEFNQARITLEDRIIRAPIPGHVGMSEVDVGDRVATGTLITTLDNRDDLLVSFNVPEVLSGSISWGENIVINPWNSREAAAYGEIVEIGSRIDEVTRSFLVRARVINSLDQLRPGMSFRVSLEINGDSYPAIPEIALQWGIDGSYVWSVTNNQAYQIPARIVQRQQGHILVDADLVEGELVVVEGVQRLSEGIKVRHNLSPAEGKGAELTQTTRSGS